MTNRNTFIFSSILFTIGWFSNYYYQCYKLDQVEEARIIEYYKGSKEVTPIWDKFTTEEKVQGVWEYDKQDKK